MYQIENLEYIVKKCPSYLIGKCTTTMQDCAEITNCTMKNVIDFCLEYKDKGRINLLLNSKHLTDVGRQTKRIIQMFEVEEIKGE